MHIHRALWLVTTIPVAMAVEPPRSPSMNAATFEHVCSVPVACRYWLALPPEYDAEPDRRWPLLMFLHGAGERGDDIELVKKHGPPKLIAAGRAFPFIVVAPQCPADDWWTSTRQILTLKALLDAIIAAHRVDPDRVYLTGLSMGGYGTWQLACEYPGLFAAIAPICGGGPRQLAYRLRRVPAWAFHGARDSVVPPSESDVMVEALRRAGGTAQFTLYPEAGHDAWTAAYDDPALYDWMLRQVRPPAAEPSALSDGAQRGTVGQGQPDRR